MVQEIITYLIVGAAVIVAFLKIKKWFVNKKKSTKSTNNTKVAQQSCADCSSDCMIRNSIDSQKENGIIICEKNNQ